MEIEPIFIMLRFVLLSLTSISFLIPAVRAATCNANDRASLLEIQAGFSKRAIVPWNANHTDCCSWEGIACSSSGRVSKLDLPNAPAYGSSFPQVVCKLSELENLTLLSFGEITGVIPSCIGTDLPKLRYLDLRKNRLVGKIPKELGNLKSLEYLDLGGLNLDTTIPTELCNLKSLYHLDLSRSSDESKRQSSGSIPSCLGSLTNLRVLILQDISLAGTIPASLGNLVRLETLRLDGNDFTGSIPPSLGNLVNLKEFHLNGMRISGEMPATFKQLVSLEDFFFEGLPSLGGRLPDFSGYKSITRLKISNTKITGAIPIINGKLLTIEEFNLDQNQLTGSIPPLLAASLPNLKRLYLSDNKLSGSIPGSLGRLYNLDLLYLRNNALSGTIPASLGNLTNLYFFTLNNNKLSGTIPASLGNLKHLYTFSVSNNTLSGKIPKALSKYGQESFEGNAGLCGAPLPRRCSPKKSL